MGGFVEDSFTVTGSSTEIRGGGPMTFTLDFDNDSAVGVAVVERRHQDVVAFTTMASYTATAHKDLPRSSRKYYYRISFTRTGGTLNYSFGHV